MKKDLVDTAKAEIAVRMLLEACSQDLGSDGLKGTPARVARMWRDFFEYDAGTIATEFTLQQVDQMVVVSGMHVWSMCEHHLLPFHSKVSVAYIPHNGKVLGLSKFGRIVQDVAHALQMQERMVQQIADRITQVTKCEDVAVVAQGEHLCMSMRGVRTPATMTTSVMRGRFFTAATVRAEFMALCTGK